MCEDGLIQMELDINEIHSRLAELKFDLSEDKNMGRQGLGVQQVENLVTDTIIKVLIRLGIRGDNVTGDTDMRHQGQGVMEPSNDSDMDRPDVRDETKKTEEEAPADGGLMN